MAPAKDSILVKYFYPAGCAVVGVLTAGCSNYYARRPFHAGIQRHIVFGLIGGLFGVYIDRVLERKWMERDAIIRHYIELHPEDFQEKKRKYKEIFDEWYPIR